MSLDILVEKDIDNVELFTEEEKEQYAEENLGLVHYVINSLNTMGYDKEEILDVGLFGFAKAISSFDKNKGNKFSTYACNCIRNEIIFYMKKESKHNRDISLSKEIKSDSNKVLYLEDTITDLKDGINKIEKELIDSERSYHLIKAISKLSEDEQFIINSRYGINNHKILTQDEIGKYLNMSQPNISRIEHIAIMKLKFYLQKIK